MNQSLEVSCTALYTQTWMLIKALVIYSLQHNLYILSHMKSFVLKKIANSMFNFFNFVETKLMANIFMKADL